MAGTIHHGAHARAAGFGIGVLVAAALLMPAVAAVPATAASATAASATSASATAASVTATSATAEAAAVAAPQVRVNQVGYAPDSPKVAYAMVKSRVAQVMFTISGRHGVVFRGRSNAYVGTWNSNYRAVYALDFSALHRIGSYRISINAAGAVGHSPAFRVDPPKALYGRLVLNAVRYFTSERDGGGVVHSVLNREPANLTDRRATVYKQPVYDHNDNLLGTFHKIGGPVDVSGGWFDAGGGYEKFAYTVSYADGLMLLAARYFPKQYPTLGPEADYGLSWLEKLWRPAKKVLYIQVGIGNGNASNTIQGDYNFWFLPQAEDRLNVGKGGNPGPSAYYVRYRPVFAAAAAGQRISPDFAGRFAADFALAAQLEARGNPESARHLLARARGIFALAKTTGVGQIVTTFPHDYYPGSQWKSDMAWGAAEIALADRALHEPHGRFEADLAAAARWARAYIAQGHPAGGDTLNLYDTGAIAEAELLQAISVAHGRPAITPGSLLADMAAQLRLGENAAKGDPFALGSSLGNSDASPHAFGLFITNALYQRYGGSDAFEAFAQQQLSFALGANGWGASLVVGAGSMFPHCMQSEIANLAGSLSGKGNIQLGATTDGPSNPANFVGLGTVTGMRACSFGNFKPFNTKTAAYEDNVVSWPSVEPSADYSANSLLAFALAAASAGHHR